MSPLLWSLLGFSIWELVGFWAAKKTKQRDIQNGYGWTSEDEWVARIGLLFGPIIPTILLLVERWERMEKKGFKSWFN